MDGLRLTWSLIGQFFEHLPPEVVMVASFGFIGFMIIGFLGWFK